MWIFSGDLKKHMHTIHEGHKDFKCESCGKSFSHAHTLKKHIHTIHEGHKDYKCVPCGNSFSQAHHLKRHIFKIHEWEHTWIIFNIHSYNTPKTQRFSTKFVNRIKTTKWILLTDLNAWVSQIVQYLVRAHFHRTELLSQLKFPNLLKYYQEQVGQEMFFLWHLLDQTYKII